MIFDIDSDTVLNSVLSALETAVDDGVTEDQFNRIANQIDEALPGIIALITHDIRAEWQERARDGDRWGSKYAAAINSRVTGTEGQIFLDETIIDKTTNRPAIMFAKMMELGVKTWSIKDALLRSDRVKVGPDGVKYIIVPMAVATPRQESQGTPMSRFGGRVMTEEIHNIVKNGERYDGSIMTSNDQGAKEVDISGLSRYNTRQRHSQYGIFRRVSERSKGWQYPNIPPEPVFNGVLEYVNRRIFEVLTEFCAAIVEENSEG